MAQFKHDLAIKETIRVDIFRGHRGFYLDTPDETPETVDLITNTGRIFLANRIGAAVDSAIAHMAIGSGTTAAALTDTALVNEIRSAHVAGAVGRKVLATNSAITNNVYTAVATWGGAADAVTSVAITEAGLFNGSAFAAGSMFQRVTFSNVTLADSDLLKVTLETNVGSNTI